MERRREEKWVIVNYGISVRDRDRKVFVKHRVGKEVRTKWEFCVCGEEMCWLREHIQVLKHQSEENSHAWATTRGLPPHVTPTVACTFTQLWFSLIWASSPLFCFLWLMIYFSFLNGWVITGELWSMWKGRCIIYIYKHQHFRCLDCYPSSKNSIWLE